ncbi:MAG: YbjN domain-containing protein [Deltaproteobacteria bacterium]|jgi:hypothetical protein|nr:YbjN domain-containing protein [Deltaproteobacteria bacterium]
MPRIRLFLGLASLLTTLLVAGMASQNALAADGTVHKKITGDELASLMRGWNYDVDHEAGESRVIWELNGRRGSFAVDSKNEAILYYTAIQNEGTTIEEVNAWNQTKRFSRSYMDEDNDPVLELDLDFAGGITEARLHDFIITVEQSHRAWYNEVIAGNSSSDSPPSDRRDRRARRFGGD